jgi:hypothetical protein
VKIIFPVGVEVSMLSFRLTKSMPYAANSSKARSKCEVERANLSKHQPNSTQLNPTQLNSEMRDTRPALERVKSGFKIAGILGEVCASVLVLLSFLPIYRIEARAWHWKHGNNVQAGDVTVPFPNEMALGTRSP